MPFLYPHQYLLCHYPPEEQAAVIYYPHNVSLSTLHPASTPLYLILSNSPFQRSRPATVKTVSSFNHTQATFLSHFYINLSDSKPATMKFLISTTVTIFSILAIASSTPLPHPSTKNTTTTEHSHSHTHNHTAPYPLTKRLPGQSGVYLCTDPNFSGTCQAFDRPYGACIDLLSPYLMKVSSVGPDFGSICNFYSSHACTNHGSSLTGIVYPGIRALLPDIDNRILSYMCTATG